MHVYGFDQALFWMETGFTLLKQRLQGIFNVENKDFNTDCKEFAKYFLRCTVSVSCGKIDFDATSKSDATLW